MSGSNVRPSVGDLDATPAVPSKPRNPLSNENNDIRQLGHAVRRVSAV